MTNEFSIPRGATDTFLVTCRLRDLDLTTGWSVFFTARVRDVVVITKANDLGGGSAAEIEIIDASHLRIKFVAADTERTPVCGEADVFITKAAERLQIVAPCPFAITKAVTLTFP